jgi:hypothetical protein
MRRLFWALIPVAMVAGMYLVTPRVLQVVRGAGTITPSGNYDITGFQIFTFPGPTGVGTGYCGFTGTAHFSGGSSDPVGAIGTATISITLRCNGVVLEPSPQTQSASYQITGTNEFIATASGDPNGPVHGRTLANGDIVLLDGTTRNPIFGPGAGIGSLIDYATLARRQSP